MRNALLGIGVVTLLLSVGCVSSQRSAEAGCAMCIYNMKDVRGCKLAVKVDGKAYLVDGAGIDDLGDAHADDGICITARKVIVDGKVEGDRFVAKMIKLAR